jgi:hypothetical protein
MATTNDRIGIFPAGRPSDTPLATLRVRFRDSTKQARIEAATGQGYVTINRVDFDPALHERVTDDE